MNTSEEGAEVNQVKTLKKIMMVVSYFFVAAWLDPAWNAITYGISALWTGSESVSSALVILCLGIFIYALMRWTSWIQVRILNATSWRKLYENWLAQIPESQRATTNFSKFLSGMMFVGLLQIVFLSGLTGFQWNMIKGAFEQPFGREMGLYILTLVIQVWVIWREGRADREEEMKKKHYVK